MPELPEVETVRRGLEPFMNGARIIEAKANRPGLRFPFPEKFTERLKGRRILSVGRRAKFLQLDLDSQEILVMHLGMSGSFRIEQSGEQGAPGAFYHARNSALKHDHVSIEVNGPKGAATIIYNDPRRFGYMDLVDRAAAHTHPHFANLGIEPTGNTLNGSELNRMFAGKQTPLKSALLDQRLIAGLGNIYVCEALWRAKLSPRRKASTITSQKKEATERTELLAQSIREVIAEAIEAGGSSLRDHRQTDGSLGYFQHNFAAYNKEGAPCQDVECDGVIRRIVQSGRSTFYCPKCQR